MLCCVVALHEVYRACFGLRRDEEQSRQAFEKGRREIYYSPSASSQTGWHSLGKAKGQANGEASGRAKGPTSGQAKSQAGGQANVQADGQSNCQVDTVSTRLSHIADD